MRTHCEEEGATVQGRPRHIGTSHHYTWITRVSTYTPDMQNPPLSYKHNSITPFCGFHRMGTGKQLWVVSIYCRGNKASMNGFICWKCKRHSQHWTATTTSTATQLNTHLLKQPLVIGSPLRVSKLTKCSMPIIMHYWLLLWICPHRAEISNHRSRQVIYNKCLTSRQTGEHTVWYK